MRRGDAVLVGVLVVLAGCLGGGVSGTATTDATTTDAVTTADRATAGAGPTGTTTGSATSPTTEQDCGRTTTGGGGEPADASATRTGTAGGTETAPGTATTTPPATTDVERNVTATFVMPGCENVTVTLGVADEPEERRRGLMYRQSLADRSGMVFVYDDAAPRTFWMKNTYVPLDIVFVSADRTVLNVAHAQAQPHAPAAEVDRYDSDGPAKYVVELPRGFANRTGVGPGTRLVFEGTPPEAGPGTPDSGD